MNSKVYKSCGVPQCNSSSLKNPNKLFVHVPNNKKVRFKWFNLARRNPKDVDVHSHIYFCEDHFDLPNDMANFMEYHVMGSVAQVRMKPGCVPSKFQCQPNRRKRMSDIPERYTQKKQRRTLTEVCIKESSVTTKALELGETSSRSATESVPKKTVKPDLKAYSKCSICSKNISGFLFACVQCNERVCGACDARGRHAKHFVLRAPTDRSEEELRQVLGLVRDAVLALALPAVADHVEQAQHEEEIILKSEIKVEFDACDDPLRSTPFDELARDSTDSAADSLDPQIVPLTVEMKQEPISACEDHEAVYDLFADPYDDTETLEPQTSSHTSTELTTDTTQTIDRPSGSQILTETSRNTCKATNRLTASHKSTKATNKQLRRDISSEVASDTKAAGRPPQNLHLTYTRLPIHRKSRAASDSEEDQPVVKRKRSTNSSNKTLQKTLERLKTEGDAV